MGIGLRPATTPPPLNQGECGRLLTFYVDTIGGDGRVGYRSYTIHSSSQIGDSRDDSARHASRTEDINHSSLFKVGESFDGVQRSGSRSWTILYPNHHSYDHGR